jgi:hypothetical protein
VPSAERLHRCLFRFGPISNWRRSARQKTVYIELLKFSTPNCSINCVFMDHELEMRVACSSRRDCRWELAVLGSQPFFVFLEPWSGMRAMEVATASPRSISQKNRLRFCSPVLLEKEMLIDPRTLWSATRPVTGSWPEWPPDFDENQIKMGNVRGRLSSTKPKKVPRNISRSSHPQVCGISTIHQREITLFLVRALRRVEDGQRCGAPRSATNQVERLSQTEKRTVIGLLSRE